MGQVQYGYGEVKKGFRIFDAVVMDCVFNNIVDYKEILNKKANRANDVPVIMHILKNIGGKISYDVLDKTLSVLEWSKHTDGCILRAFLNKTGTNKKVFRMLDYIKDNDVPLSEVYIEPVFKISNKKIDGAYVCVLMDNDNILVGNLIAHMNYDVTRDDLSDAIWHGAQNAYSGWLYILSEYMKHNFKYEELNNDLARFLHIIDKNTFDNCVYQHDIFGNSDVFFEKNYTLLESKKIKAAIGDKEYNVIKGFKV